VILDTFHSSGWRSPCAANVLAAVLLATSGPAAAQDGPVHTLSDLTKSADAASFGLRAARHRIAAAEAQLGEAKVSPFFQFRIDSGLTAVPDARGVPGYDAQPPQLQRSFGPAASVGIRGTVPIWTFGKIDAAQEAASHGVDAAEHGLSRTRNRLRYDIRRAYFAVQLALDLQQMIGEGKPKLDKAKKRIDQAAKDGTPVEGDDDPLMGYRLTTALAELEGRTSQAKLLEAGALEALQTLTSIDAVRVPDCPLAVTVFESHDRNWYEQAALDHRPELGMLRAAIGARQANVDAKDAGYYPDLALALRADVIYAPGRTVWDQYDPYDVAGGLVARWKLDFWGNSLRTDRAREQLLETVAQRRLAQQGILLEVATRREALLDAQRRIQAWESGHSAGRKWFISAAQAYQVGTATTKQLIDGVKEYFKARYAHLQAIHDHNVALAALELATGAELVPADRWERSCELPPDE